MAVFVCGYPSARSASDVELWHTLRIWRKHGLEVCLIPTWRPHPEWRRRCERLGCTTFECPGPGGLDTVPILAGSVVVAFGNREFLRHAAAFRALGCKTIWVSLSGRLSTAERRLHSDHGEFDAYVFQSTGHGKTIFKELAPFGVTKDKCFVIRGALDISDFPYRPLVRPEGGEFCVGRYARPEAAEWHSRTWAIYGRIPYSARKAKVLGWGPAVARKLGSPPPWAEAMRPYRHSPREFLSKLHALVTFGDGRPEAWPRCGLAAMAAGVPVIAEDSGGWKEMILHGETGFLARSEEEFAYYAARLAMEESYRLKIAKNARLRLVGELADPKAIWGKWLKLFTRVYHPVPGTLVPSATGDGRSGDSAGQRLAVAASTPE